MRTACRNAADRGVRLAVRIASARLRTHRARQLQILLLGAQGAGTCWRGRHCVRRRRAGHRGHGSGAPPLGAARAHPGAPARRFPAREDAGFGRAQLLQRSRHRPIAVRAGGDGAPDVVQQGGRLAADEPSDALAGIAARERRQLEANALGQLEQYAEAVHDRTARPMRPEQRVLQRGHALAQGGGRAAVDVALARQGCESAIDGRQRFTLRAVALQRPGGNREEREQESAAGNQRGGLQRGPCAARRMGGGDDEQDHGRHADPAGGIAEDARAAHRRNR